MQFPTLTLLTLLLPFLPLISTAPLAPTNTTTTPTHPSLLQKRAHYGWIGSSTSPTCTSSTTLVGPRPKINDAACHPFTPATNNLAISFGSWPLGFGALDVFEDEECEVKIDTIKIGEGEEGGCVDVGKRGLGKVGSVKSGDSRIFF